MTPQPSRGMIDPPTSSVSASKPAAAPRPRPVPAAAPVEPSWFARMLGSTPKPPAPRPANDDDALFEFSSEAAPVAVATAPAAPAAPPKPGGRLGVIVITAVVVTAAATYGLTRLKLPSFGGGAASGKLTVTTRPEGADVLVDGQPRGVTPLTLALPPGEHSLAIRSGGVERLLPLTVAAGADIVRDL
jgi:PEGA domain